jgi:hypothetical protein
MKYYRLLNYRNKNDHNVTAGDLNERASETPVKTYYEYVTNKS